MNAGGAKPGPATRNAASCSNVRPPTNARNCLLLGIEARDTGQSRLPLPPHMMKGRMLCCMSRAAPQRQPISPCRAMAYVATSERL